MSQLQSIEVSAPDIEAAIAKGIADLGVTREEVMVEVLEEPRRRLLGLGVQQAKVRLTVIRAPATPDKLPEKAPEKASEKPAEARRESRESARPQPEPQQPQAPQSERPAERKAEKQPERPARTATSDKPSDRPARPARPAPRLEHEVEEAAPAFEEFEDEDLPVRPPTSDADMAEEARAGALVLRQILQSMGIQAEVETRRAETDGNEPQHWSLDIRGEELGMLIGRRGETLAALQYLTRLITSRELGHRANLVVDVEGYKARREDQLRRLAKRMAEQAVQRGRTVSMEPMPPHERRIVHLALRDNPDVFTESIGEGDRRKVTVVPRRMQQQ